MNRLTYLIAGGVAVALALLTATGLWPGWLGALLAGGAGVAIVAIAHRIQPESTPVALPERLVPFVPPPPPVVRPFAASLQGVPLPSADADYRFLLYATVCWRIRIDGADQLYPHPEELAKRIVIERASQLTAHEPPGAYDLVQHRLATALAVVVQDHTGSVDVWAQGVSLGLPNEDLERQHRLATARKNAQVWAHEIDQQRNVRSYLRNDVLGDTGSAVIWWLSQDPKQVQQAVEMIPPLAELTAAANNRNADATPDILNGGGHAQEPPLFSPPPAASREDIAANSVGSIADLLFTANAGPERSRFADHIARLVEHYGAADLAARIRLDFDAPDVFTPDPDAPDAAPDHSGADHGTSDVGVGGSDFDRPDIGDLDHGIPESRSARSPGPEPDVPWSVVPDGGDPDVDNEDLGDRAPAAHEPHADIPRSDAWSNPAQSAHAATTEPPTSQDFGPPAPENGSGAHRAPDPDHANPFWPPSPDTR